MKILVTGGAGFIGGLLGLGGGFIMTPVQYMLFTSVSMAQVGAITVHHLPAKQLRYIFIAVMFYMGLRMLGTSN